MVACNQMVINKHYNYSPALTRGLFIIYHSLIIARARDRHNNHKNISNTLTQPAVFSFIRCRERNKMSQILYMYEKYEMHVNDERRI